MVDKENCQSKRCNLECINFCPVNKNGYNCIVLNEEERALISEELCTGCGICVKKCPFEAITIVNLPHELGEEKIHQYGVNSFRLYRLPLPKVGSVVGLVGRNGIGKSTAISVLAGLIKPNFGEVGKELSWEEIVDNIRDKELKEHFEKLSSKKLRASFKPQYIYLLPQFWSKDVRSLIDKKDEKGEKNYIIEELNLRNSLDKKLSELSGGELQRVAIALCYLKDAEIYFFDEPSSYNDVYQRLKVSRIIRSLAEKKKAIIVVEHDITLLDYLSDYIHILYGEQGVYGIVSNRLNSKSGINYLLDGYLPPENVRFRDIALSFEIYSPIEEAVKRKAIASYSNLKKSHSSFTLSVNRGEIMEGEVVGILGANALGKSTFVKMVAGVEKPDEGEIFIGAKISYKPQYLNPAYEESVQSLLEKTVGQRYLDSYFQSNLILPLKVHKLFDKNVKDLSGGELQKVAITLCLLRDVKIYVLDEPSAFIDVEDRLVLGRALQKLVKDQGNSALVVDHDIFLIDMIADSLLIFKGEPSERGEVIGPLSKREGMNLFLKELEITYRRDKDSKRPRVNKPQSRLDREQKEKGEYYYSFF